VHDCKTYDSTLHLKLALMDTTDGLPVALGVIRSVEAPTYDSEYEKQIAEVQEKSTQNSFTDFLLSQSNIWEVK
jgi:2-oxoglutarate ferredoxin oxidoreductase subunit beta